LIPILRRLVAFAFVATLVACGNQPPVTLDGVSSVQILGGDRTLPVGASTLLTPLVVAQNVATTVTWSSSNETVASVSPDGLVSAIEVGAATITATSTADAARSGSVVVNVTADPTASYTAEGTVVSFEGGAAVLGVALALIAVPEEVEVLRTSVVEVEEGVYVGPVSPIGPDGRFTLAFPHADALPETVSAPADDFVLDVRTVDDCTLTATDPAARITSTTFSFLPIPAVVAVTAEGLALTITLDELVDITDASLEFTAFTFPTWVHADRAVSVETTGAGCTLVDAVIDVDVTLTQGWNQLAWSFVIDAETDDVLGHALRNGDGEVFSYPAFGL
jgi:hypothetical protein